MKQVTNEQNFSDVLNYCKKHNLYLGLGNPKADILIVGKEYHHKYDTDKEKNNLEKLRDEIIAQEKKVVDENLEKWQEEDLIPITKDKDGYISPTWVKCQKLIDFISPNKNFYEYCFTTELSQIPLQESRWLPKELDYLRKESIEKRKKLISCSPFFQRFPIVILSGVGGYYKTIKKDNEKNEIEKIFGVEYKKLASAKGYWLHQSDKKMVIHVAQLGSWRHISLTLLEEIADKIVESKFIKHE
jgi:hypothetical protein